MLALNQHTCSAHGAGGSILGRMLRARAEAAAQLGLAGGNTTDSGCCELVPAAVLSTFQVGFAGSSRAGVRRACRAAHHSLLVARLDSTTRVFRQTLPSSCARPLYCAFLLLLPPATDVDMPRVPLRLLLLSPPVRPSAQICHSGVLCHSIERALGRNVILPAPLRQNRVMRCISLTCESPSLNSLVLQACWTRLTSRPVLVSCHAFLSASATLASTTRMSSRGAHELTQRCPSLPLPPPSTRPRRPTHSTLLLQPRSPRTHRLSLHRLLPPARLPHPRLRPQPRPSTPPLLLQRS